MSKVKHIALIKFKEGTSEDQINKAFDEIMDLSESVPGIEDYVSGANISPQGLSKGFSHAFVMTFADVAARDAYLVHADHQRVNANLQPLLDECTVVDFEL